MHQKKRLGLAVSTALGLTSLAMIPGQLLAQDQQSEDELDDLLVEEVVVTGSRLISEDGFGRTSPVTVVGMEDISSYGLTRIEDVLNNLPQIEAAQNAFISNGSTGTASIDLRGLGTARTLVLVNGRRMQPGGVKTLAPDVNQIPAAMIERVEVLTGGASATYGADAVAGVVNFIMRRVDGVEISVGGGAYRHDNNNKYIQGLMDEAGFPYPSGDSGFEGENYNFDFVLGGDFADGRGNGTAYISWRKNNELRQEARDYASCALNASATACGGSGNAIIPNFYVSPLEDPSELFNWGDYDYLTLASDSSLIPSVGNVYNYNPINHFQRPDERYSFGSFLDFELNQHAVLYAEGMYTKDVSRAQIAESGTFFNEPYALPIDNALFPETFRNSLLEIWPDADYFGFYIGKRNVEGGPRSDNTQYSAFRIVAGVKGMINESWDYDVSYLVGETESSSTYINDFFAPNISQAVNSEVCAATPGCIPYEVFTYQGVTPEQAAGLTGVAVRTNASSTKVFNAYVTGNTGFGLSAGEITMAGGYEWRKVGYDTVSDTIYEDGLLLGQGGPRPSIAGGYTVDELFVEANVPLLADLPLVDQLTLDLAYRWSDYSTGYSTDTYRFGVDWSPVDTVRVRAGYNRAVRAPSVTELFSTQSLQLWTGVDPCSGDTPEYSEAQCAATGVTAAQYGNILPSPAGQYNQIGGGNPDLDPESADTFTVGVVWDILDGLSLSVDWWDIEIEDTIGGVNPETSIRLCAEQGLLCELINRGGGGSLWTGTAGYVIATQQNLGTATWEGVDLAAAYTFDGLGGTWNIDMIGTYMLDRTTEQIAGVSATEENCVGKISPTCFPAPEWRHTATATYDSNSWWAVTARWRFYLDVDYDGTTDTIVDDQIGNQNYLDLNAVFRFMGTHDVQIGVNNVLDEDPPLMGNSFGFVNGNAVPGFWDILGQYWYGKVTFRW
jgi:iron complex outermembrane receptor protein